MHKFRFLIFGLLIFFYTNSVIANSVEHLIISEVVYGNSNAADEFVELYNPTNSDINLENIGLTLHVRNSKGTSDSNKTITWNNSIIPAYGYFLFASKTSETYLDQADALYSASLVNDGAVYISYSSSKMTDVIDFISWGAHSSPAGYEAQITSPLDSGQSIERMSSSGVIEEGKGNNWDSDTNDFLIQNTPNPQNSSSIVEVWEVIITDTTPPSEISDLQSVSTGSSSVILQWINPIDEDFSGLILTYGDQTKTLPPVTTTTIDNLIAETEYTFIVQTQDALGNISTGVSLIITTLAEPEIIAPNNVSNIQTTEITDTLITLQWINPTENFDTVFIQKENEGYINIGTLSTYQFTSLNPDTLYSFSFQTKNAENILSDQSIFQAQTNIATDVTPPSEISNIQTSRGITQLDITWDNPNNQDFSHILISLNGSDVENIQQRNSVHFDGLSFNANQTIQIQTVDTSGNISTGITQIISTLNCSPENNTVFINEIAWPGMTALSTDDQALSYGHRYQWIELFNNSSEMLDLTGYTITSDEGHEILLNDLNISSSDFLLLQNSESEIFNGDIIPDLYYDDPDSDHRFQSTTTNIQLVDPCGNILESIPELFTGDYTTYRPMARKDINLSPSDQSAWFNEKVNGSPGESNIVYDTNLSIAYVTPNPYFPRPDTNFTLGIDVSNLNDDSIGSEYWSISITDQWGEIIATTNGVTLQNYGDFDVIDIEIPGQPEGVYTFTASIICGESCGEYSYLDQDIEVKISPWISEMMVYPNDEENEWIELYNPTDEDIIAGSLLCRDETCITIEADIIAGEYFVLEQTDTDLFSGDWITLTNTSETITWKQQEWIYNWDYIEDFDDPEDEWIVTESVFDVFSYEGGKKNYSFYRDETTGALTQSSRQTKGFPNDYNQVPTAIIEIQNSGSISGYAPFYFNPDGRSSSDPDGDELSYSWDFGNGSFSSDENPDGLYYDTAGQYTVELTVNDGFGGINTTTQDLTVSKKSSGGGGSTSPKMTEVLFALSVENNIFISKVSVNDSQEDWVEVSCKDCDQGVSLYNYELYDDESFFTFPDILIHQSQSALVKLINEPRSQKNNFEFLVQKKQGLTKTDEQLTLMKDNQIVDALCWNNFDDKQAKNEILEENNLKQSNAWKGDCIASKALEEKNALLIRKNIPDTNTKDDWFILNNTITEVIPEIAPPTIADIELFISTIDIKNPQADRIILTCKECNESLFGISLSVGTSKVFTFTDQTFKNNETIEFIFSEDESLPSFADHYFFIPKKSLTGTDDALSLKDSNNDVEDFVYWSNQEGTLTRETDLNGVMYSLITKRQEQKKWEGAGLDSRKIMTGDIFIRDTFDTHLNKESLFTVQKQKVKIQEFIDGLRLSELLIDPFGDDTNFEWIELVNTSKETINLHGWSLETTTKKYEFGDREILPEAFFVLRIHESKLTLKNKDGFIHLYNPHEEIVENIEYTTVYEGAVFAKNKENVWEWSSMKTPGFSNVMYPIQTNIQDSDHDGLSDALEVFLGTNPFKRDTDGDKLPDGFEVENNLDPLVFTDIGEDIFAEYLQEITTQKIVLPEEKEEGILSIKGNTEPFATIKLYVHSKPRVFIAKADKNGKWIYNIPELEKGDHTVISQVIDSSGIRSKNFEPITFYLENEYIKPEIFYKQAVQKKLQQQTILMPKKEISYNAQYISQIVPKKITPVEARYLKQDFASPQTIPIAKGIYFLIGLIFFIAGVSSFFLAKKIHYDTI